jgi:multisubunit Na+/H+ antiporter MnhE subunit
MNNKDRQKQDSYRITFYAMIAIIGLLLIEIIRSVNIVKKLVNIAKVKENPNIFEIREY